MELTTKEMIEVMQAYEAGCKIECLEKFGRSHRWEYVPEPIWDWSGNIYRIKKEPKRVYVISYEYGGFSYTMCDNTREAARTYVTAVLPGATIKHEFWAKEEV